MECMKCKTEMFNAKFNSDVYGVGAYLTNKKKGILEYDRDLFAQLRVLRKSLADKKGVPPFVIFSDVALQEMAYYLPQNTEEFLQISGVGIMKLEQYGEKFIAAISLYSKRKGVVGKKKDFPVRRSRNSSRSMRASSTFFETKRMLETGMSLEQIAKTRGLSLGTVVSHLEKLKVSGEEIKIDHLRPSKDRLEKMKLAFEKSGGKALSPVKELLGEDFSYEELRLGRLFL